MSYKYTYIEDKQFKTQGALWPFLRRIMGYAYGYKQFFWPFVIAVAFIAACDAVFPLFWMYYLDGTIVPLARKYAQNVASNQMPLSIDWATIVTGASLFLLNGIVQVICVYSFIKYAGYIEETVMYDLRRQMFVRLQALPYSFFDRSAAGWLLSRLSSDTPRVTRLISWGFLEFIWGILMIMGSLLAMFIYKWQLALIVTLSIPILALVSIRLRLLILKYSRMARKLNSEITAHYTEHINGVAVNKITAQEDRVGAEFSILTNDMQHASYRAAYYTALYMPLVISIGSVTAAIVLYYGGLMTLLPASTFTVGALAAFFNYAGQIYWPILEISRFYADAQGSLSAGERIFSLIDEEPDIKNTPDAIDFSTLEGDIRFENVCFGYSGEKSVLQNFNLHIPAGQSVALVGATGGGKSTITSLIGRFYEPTNGTIRIDGIDYRTRTLNSLRRQLGVVLQTPHLFSGTLRQNILYGRLTATDEDIKNVLEMISAEHFIPRLDEQVGEGGENLSMGEKQLVSFARALIVNPRIIIMDEATASIDTLTEARLQSGIEQMIQGRTAIIIAHRLSTIKNCDRILLIKHGQIVEDGTHKELMHKKGYYYNLYLRQRQEEVAAHLEIEPENIEV